MLVVVSGVGEERRQSGVERGKFSGNPTKSHFTLLQRLRI